VSDGYSRGPASVAACDNAVPQAPNKLEKYWESEQVVTGALALMYFVNGVWRMFRVFVNTTLPLPRSCGAGERLL